MFTLLLSFFESGEIFPTPPPPDDGTNILFAKFMSLIPEQADIYTCIFDSLELSTV